MELTLHTSHRLACLCNCAETLSLSTEMEKLLKVVHVWHFFFFFICVHVVPHKDLCVLHACTYAHVLEPQMYQPAGDLHEAPVASTQSDLRQETADHWCWRFGSECEACYSQRIRSPWAVQSHLHRMKLERQKRERYLHVKKTEKQGEYMCDQILVCFAGSWLSSTQIQREPRIWKGTVASREYSKHKASQVKHRCS